MYFGTKSYLKSNHYHTTKHTYNLSVQLGFFLFNFSDSQLRHYWAIKWPKRPFLSTTWADRFVGNRLWPWFWQNQWPDAAFCDNIYYNLFYLCSSFWIIPIKQFRCDYIHRKEGRKLFVLWHPTRWSPLFG
jgi:hypothetical protein